MRFCLRLVFTNADGYMLIIMLMLILIMYVTRKRCLNIDKLWALSISPLCICCSTLIWILCISLWMWAWTVLILMFHWGFTDINGSFNSGIFFFTKSLYNFCQSGDMFYCILIKCRSLLKRIGYSPFPPFPFPSTYFPFLIKMPDMATVTMWGWS